MNYVNLSVKQKVGMVEINNEANGNLLTLDFWFGFPQLLTKFLEENNLSCLVVYGKGEHFSQGLDLKNFIPHLKQHDILPANSAKRREQLRLLILKMQQAINILAEIEIPVIAAIHGNCIGGALDLISACDIRYCSSDVLISLREAKVSIVADMGSLQRLPFIIGEANTRELAFTAKDINANEALRLNLVSKVLEDKEQLLEFAQKQAKQISKYSLQVLKGIKHTMNQATSAQIKENLNQVATWNSSFLESEGFLRLMRILDKKG